ncbi:LysR substrate-binding domain-containing protein [Zoogloeaceae bacterium G21618-S1]|nr:LysR substrate-binding domain-containing protein [Zoogloeaceae bacterium G21618-S1]
MPYLCYSSNSYLGRVTAAVIEREDLSKQLEFSYECSMSDVLKRGALAGAGIAWIPELAVRDELAAGLLVQAGADAHTAPLTITLFRQSEPARNEVERIWAACKPDDSAPHASPA